MNHFSSKICILGDFAVGKTSTVERFVNNQFSDKYLTTVGVKVDIKDLEFSDDLKLKLIIWDIAGTDQFGEVEFAYLRGASAYILVADGTRAQTVAAALKLKKQADERYGEVPFVFLLNKADLTHAWEISDAQLAALRETCPDVVITSAKTGENVEETIMNLGRVIAERDFLRPQ